MSVWLLDTGGTLHHCVGAPLEAQNLGPVCYAGSIGELADGAPGASAVILDLAEDPGLGICRKVHAADPLVPLMVLFDEQSAEHLEAALGAGATDCIAKPVNPLELCARVRSAAWRRRGEESEAGGDSPPLHLMAGFGENLERAWRRDRRSSLPLSVLVVNVDHMTAYNRRYGRAAGDECLRRIAAALREGLFRPDDLIACRGGGEFVILLPGTDGRGAAVVAERLRAAILDLAIPHDALAGPVTISLGAATARPTVDPSPDDLVAAAERALSRAKLEGRNRAVVEENATLTPLG